ncbi:hypothetical protein [Micromonospora sp. NPDC050200]
MSTHSASRRNTSGVGEPGAAVLIAGLAVLRLAPTIHSRRPRTR